MSTGTSRIVNGEHGTECGTECAGSPTESPRAASKRRYIRAARRLRKLEALANRLEASAGSPYPVEWYLMNKVYCMLQEAKQRLLRHTEEMEQHPR